MFIVRIFTHAILSIFALIISTTGAAGALQGEPVCEVSNFAWKATPDTIVSLSAPTLSISSDDEYDIFSVELKFSGGKLAGAESAFSAEYSFSMPGGNIESVSLSADDELTVSTANIFEQAEWTKATGSESVEASSEWIPSAAATVDVSGSYLNKGGPYSASLSVKMKRDKLMIRTVSVRDIAGKKLQLADDTGTAFTGEDWDNARTRKTNPIGLIGGTEIVLIPAFESKQGGSGVMPTAVRAEITINGETTIVEKLWSQIEDGFSAGAPVPANTVDFFDASQKQMSVKWFLRYNPSAWRDAGGSVHEIYFTKTTPITDLRQESLFWIACAGAVRGKSSDDDIASAIWSKFTPLNLTRKDGKPMTYWGEGALRDDTKYFFANELLQEADGKCGAWADLLCAAFGAHGINAEVFGIVPIRRVAEYLLIQNHTFYESTAPEENPNTDLDYLYAWYEKEEDRLNLAVPAAVDEYGIAGQNNENPKTFFSNHALVQLDGKTYDPSYGKQFSSLVEWQKSALAGFLSRGVYLEIPDDDGRRGARKLTTGTLEITKE